MKRTANKVLRSLVCLLLTIFLLTLGFPFQAEAEHLVSLIIDKSEAAHGEKLIIDGYLSVYIPTAEGVTKGGLFLYRNSTLIASTEHSGIANSGFVNQTVILLGFGTYYIIPEENIDSCLFTWTSWVDINGTRSEDSGFASVKILHSFGPWSHNGTTSGADSHHTRACVCGKDESQACSFNDVVTLPTCTEGGFTMHTCSECGYSYQDTSTLATDHKWSGWTHDTGTSGVAGTHSRVCGNDTSHKETEGCSFTSAVTLPTCTQGGFTTHTCSECGYQYKSDEENALGHDFRRDTARDKAATCTSPGVEAWTCSRCGEHEDNATVALGHSLGEWEVTVPPTNKKTGTQAKRCTRCGVILETMKIPVLSMIWPDNTACSYGPRFRDELLELTDKWYMYTPLDLTKEGTLAIPLIASNRYRIGTVQVTVKDGLVSASYQVTADKVEVKEEFMTFLPGLEGLESVEPETLIGRAVPFGTPVDIASRGRERPIAVLHAPCHHL